MNYLKLKYKVQGNHHLQPEYKNHEKYKAERVFTQKLFQEKNLVQPLHNIGNNLISLNRNLARDIFYRRL